MDPEINRLEEMIQFIKTESTLQMLKDFNVSSVSGTGKLPQSS